MLNGKRGYKEDIESIELSEGDEIVLFSRYHEVDRWRGKYFIIDTTKMILA